MNNIYLTLAEEFERIAAGYRMLATNSDKEQDVPEQAPVAETPETKTEKPSVSLEKVRAVLADKSRAGKTAEVRALLIKFGAEKLSAIEPDQYPALLQAAEKL